SGIASATVGATRQTGTALGVAVLGAILASVTAAHLELSLAQSGVPSSSAQEIARATVGGHIDRGDLMTASIDPGSLHHQYGQAFAAGLQTGAQVAGVLTLSAAILILVLLRPRRSVEAGADQSMAPDWTTHEPAREPRQVAQDAERTT